MNKYNKISHNPFIFRGKPSEQMALWDKTDTGQHEKTMYEWHADDSIDPSNVLFEHYTNIRSRRKSEEETRIAADSLYGKAVEKLKDLGFYDAAIKTYGVPPIAPEFLFAKQELALDAPHRSKLFGIPDFRNDFKFVHAKVVRDSYAENPTQYNGMPIPEWCERSIEDTVVSIWPRDPNGGFMKFVAQVYMPESYWHLLFLSAATVVKSKYSSHCYLPSPIGDYSHMFLTNTAYVFHSINDPMSSQLNACIEWSGGGESHISWEEYVEAVKKVIPPEAYTLINDYDENAGYDLVNVVESIQLSDAVIAMHYDFGYNYDWEKKTAISKFCDLMEKAHDEFCDPICEVSVSDYVSIGGEPDSQQGPYRPWNVLSHGNEPARMAPFFSYYEEHHDMTHQIYIGKKNANEDSKFWGFDDASCT